MNGPEYSPISIRCELNGEKVTFDKKLRINEPKEDLERFSPRKISKGSLLKSSTKTLRSSSSHRSSSTRASISLKNKLNRSRREKNLKFDSETRINSKIIPFFFL